jgi:hypothetical protein
MKTKKKSIPQSAFSKQAALEPETAVGSGSVAISNAAFRSG